MGQVESVTTLPTVSFSVYNHVFYGKCKSSYIQVNLDKTLFKKLPFPEKIWYGNDFMKIHSFY